jgi:hypothetical protein
VAKPYPTTPAPCKGLLGGFKPGSIDLRTGPLTSEDEEAWVARLPAGFPVASVAAFWEPKSSIASISTC